MNKADPTFWQKFAWERRHYPIIPTIWCTEIPRSQLFLVLNIETCLFCNVTGMEWKTLAMLLWYVCILFSVVSECCCVSDCLSCDGLAWRSIYGWDRKQGRSTWKWQCCVFHICGREPFADLDSMFSRDVSLKRASNPSSPFFVVRV